MPSLDRNEVVKQYGAYVRSLASQVRRQFRVALEMEDLVAFGNIGLLEAADRYDVKFGNNFLTFAHYRIKGAIFDGLRKMGVLRGQDGATAAYGGGSNAYLTNVSDRSSGMGGSFDEAVHEVSDAVSGLAAVMAAVMGSPENIVDPAESAEEKLEKEQIKTKVVAAMQLLPEKERQLIEAYYFQGKTLEEAGAELGQSKSWSSRLHARAVSRLQEVLSKELGDDPPPATVKRGSHGRTKSSGSSSRSAGRAQGGGEGRIDEDTAVQLRPSTGDEEVTAIESAPRGLPSRRNNQGK